MKKTYTKPSIVFESFSLSTNISSGCEYPTQTPQQFSCGVLFPPLMLFTSKVTGCQPDHGGTIIESGEFDGYCYHNPSSENNMFNS